MDILVSVVMSAYNHKKYVSQAICSVLAQTYINYEFLIADDNSTDGTDDVIRGFSDSRINAYYKKENMVGCFEYLLEKAVGKYFAIIDSDDEWLPNKLEKQVAFMETHPEYAACFTHAAMIDETDNSDNVFDMPENIFRQPNRTQAEWLKYFFTNGNCLCNPSVLVKKEKFIRLEQNRALRQLPDFYTWIQLVKSHPIHIVQEDLTLHRRHIKKMSNVSFARPENIARFYEEAFCLSETYYDNIPDVLFVEAFSKLFRNPQAHTPAELTCEKYFLLLDHWQVGGNARKLSAAAFFNKNCGNKDVLNVFKNVYDYSLHDYYELTGNIHLDWLNQYLERAETAERAYTEQTERAETAERAYAEQMERAETAESNCRAYQANYISISTSTIWTISKPYRVCSDWVKYHFKQITNIETAGLGMAWRHYRAYGMKATYNKIKRKFSRRHPAVVVPDLVIEPIKGLLPEDVPYTNATVSVVIPTQNAGFEYGNLLKNICRQKCFRSIELVIVDSGSTDDTLAVSREYGAKIVEILPEEFSHSYSRNLGVEYASGEFLCIITQDALPTSNLWLYNLWRALMSSPDVAAVSCTEFPRLDSDLYYRVFSWNHYKYLGSWRRDIYMSMPAKGDADAIRRNAQLSDITCFIRRDTLLKYKYRGNFAEDLDLGMRLISDGYRLAFLGTEQVIHSHNRDSYYYFRRRFVELKKLKEIFADTEILPCAYTDVANQTVFLFLRMKNLFNNMVDDRTRTFNEFRFEFMDKYHQLRKEFFPSIGELGDGCWVGCAEGSFTEVLNRFRAIYLESNAVSRQYTGSMIDATEGYFNVVFSYLAECCELMDNDMICEFRDCAWKIIAGVAGTFLAYSWFHFPDDRKMNSEIYSEAEAGI